MCEVVAYLRKEDQEDLLLKDVEIIRPEKGKIFLKSIFGEQKWVSAEIEEIDLINHKITLVQR
jgi:predicted RNA-binding protein